MSKERVVQTFFLPPPSGGENLRDPKFLLPINEGLLLKNYYCYASYIKAVGALTTGVNLTGTQFVGGMHNWQNSGYSERLILTSDSKVTSIDASFTETNITGPVTITDGKTCATSFSDRLFICNGTDQVITVSLALACTASGFTGPTPNDSVLNQVWSYKSRLYFIEKNSNRYWYGGLLSVTGALTSVDLSSIFTIPSTLLFGTNWTNNAGANTEELMILVSAAGEVVIFSGDYPAAPNWQIIGRTRIPKPQSRRSFLKISNDIMIFTKAGIVKLADALASGATDPALLTITNKINKEFQNTNTFIGISCILAKHNNLPFIYANAEGAGGTSWIFVLNYETGAWSRISHSDPKHIAFAFDSLVVSNGQSNPEIQYFQNTSTTGNQREFDTGWTDLSSPHNKQIKTVRILSAVSEDGPTNVSYDLYVLSDFDDSFASGTYATDSKTISDTGTGTYPVQVTEFEVSSIGRWFQFVVQANGGGIDEIYGLEISYEDGGRL